LKRVLALEACTAMYIKGIKNAEGIPPAFLKRKQRQNNGENIKGFTRILRPKHPILPLR